MKNYGRDPDDDVRDIIKAEIEANDNAATDLEGNAAELRAEADKFAAKAATFRAANEKFKRQLTILNAAFEEAA